jgi:AcrR family transcriptional regulator
MIRRTSTSSQAAKKKSKATARPRVERRKAEARARIVAAAAARFASGFDEARLEEIAEDADVARATLYNLFGSKEALLAAVLDPVLDDAIAQLSAVPKGNPRTAVVAVVDVYLGLWATHRDALRVSYRVQDLPLGENAGKHMVFVRGVVQILDDAARVGALYASDGGRAARALSRVAVPLLEVYGDDVTAARSSILGALLRPE